MGRLLFFIAEALRALRRSAAPSVAAIVTISVTTVLLGVLITVLQASASQNQQVRSEVAEVKVFFDRNATQSQLTAAQKRLKQIPHVTKVSYISPKEAIPILQQRVKGQLAQSLNQLHRNPLPPSFTLQLDDPNHLEAVRSTISGQGKGAKPISPAFNSLNGSQPEAEKIRSVTATLKWVLIGLAALLLVTSLLLVANTIRLSIFARRREIEVMRLVGGTNWFIRWPFVLEGVLVGTAGALIAIGLLWVGKVLIVDPLNSFALIHDFSTIPFVPLVAGLLASAVVVSALGSGIALGRFLRV